MSRKKSHRLSPKPAVTMAAAFLALVLAALGFLELETGPAKPAFSPAEGELSVHIIDVGQGNSTLIIAPEKTVLIDAGENDKGQTVKSYLDSCGVSRIDLAIGTHPHSDHIGGLDYVIDHVAVDTVLMPDIPDELMPTNKTFLDVLDAIGRAGCKTAVARPGDTYDLGGGALLTILGPNFVPDSVNNLSIVARLDFGDASFLFSGDAEKESERALVDAGTYLEADVLGVGHHGSKTSSSKEYLAAIGPKAMAISLGAGNSYGMPHKEAVERLSPYGKLYRTDLMGDIVFVTDGESIRVLAGDTEELIDARG